MKSIIQTLVQLAFCIVAFIFTFLVTLGIRADFSILKTAEYWIQVSNNTVLMIFVYNIVFFIDQKNRTSNKGSRFFIAFQTVKLRTEIINKNKMYDKLKEAVKAENEERYRNACNDILRKHTVRFEYNDIINIDENEFIPFLDKYLIRGKQAKKLLKVFIKIKKGKIKIQELQADALLQDKELGKSNDFTILDYSDSAYERKRNIVKILSFIITSVITSVVSFTFTSMSFWQAFLTNLVLFFGSAMSGFTSSYTKTNFKTQIYENRNTFFEKRLGLSDRFELKCQ